VGAYGTISRLPARKGNMFSTAKITSVSASMAAMPASKPRRIITLPAERRVHHYDLRAEPFGEVLRAPQLLPGLESPHPLGEQQAGRVHGQDRDLVIVDQPAQHVDILAQPGRCRP